MFAPAAVHVYSRTKNALGRDIQGNLFEALGKHQDLKGLLEATFDVQHD